MSDRLVAGDALEQERTDVAQKDVERIAWILRAEVFGRGPNCEPLLRDVQPVAILEEELLEEARIRYVKNFDAGRGPADGSL